MKQQPKFFSFNHTTIAKGVAIMLVVIHHTTCHIGLHYLTPLGGIGVASFLIISGYGLMESYKKKGLNSFWKNKVIRVMIPYWIIITVFNDLSFASYLQQFFFLGPYHWFATFIIGYYIAFYVIQKYVNSPRIKLLVYFSISVSILFLCDNIKAEQAFSFYIGILISQHKEFIHNHKIKVLFLSIFIGLLFFALKQLPVIRTYDGTIFYGIIQLLIKLPLGLVVILICQYLHSKLLLLIGKMSWEIYLIHCSLLGAFYYTGTNLTNQVIFYLLVSLSSYLFYLFNSKILLKLKYV